MKKQYKTATIASVAAILSAIIALIGVIATLRNELNKLDLQRQDQYQLAAIEQRLKVHQEVYALARLCLKEPRKSKDLIEVYDKLDHVLSYKSLYLDDDSRKQLVIVLGILSQFKRNYNTNTRFDFKANSFDYEVNKLCEKLLCGVHLSPEKRNSNVVGI